ncbi:MAG: HD domain-containing protein [Ktedonobacteraceae bacterium]
MTEYVIHDDVYGTQSIHEPVLIDLLQSSAVTRLKGIHQGGSAYMVRGRRDTTRSEHSIGVMLLIHRLGGSLYEQIAGFLHDVSHTAFSHVADYVFQLEGEDYHEQHFHHLVHNSDIPSILHRHNIPLEIVLDHELWSLLEQPAPDLCADRIDYTLRDMLRVGYTDPTEIQQFLQSLVVHEGKIVTNNLSAALWFTHLYTGLVRDVFMNPLEMFTDEQLARAIRVALAQGILQEIDLFRQDEEVLQLLQAANHPEITRYLANIHPGVNVVEDAEHFDIRAFTKPRMVDPLVLIDDSSVVRCSALEPDVKRMHNEVVQRATQGVCIRQIP